MLRSPSTVSSIVSPTVPSIVSVARRHERRVARCFIRAILLLGFALGVERISHAAPKVRVVATTRVEVRGAQTESSVKVFGKVLDDAGVGVAGIQVFVSLAKLTDPSTALDLPIPALPAKLDGKEIELKTNADGSFAVDIGLSADAYAVTVRSARTPWTSASKDSLRLEPGKKSVELSFAAPAGTPALIDLDSPRVGFRVRVTSEGIEQERLEVVLKSGDKELGRVKSTRGVAVFDIASSELGSPGSGEIIALFDGGIGFAASKTRLSVRREALARLLDVRAEEAKGAIASDGVVLLGKVASRSGLNASGIVDVFLGPERVGTAAVERGDFRLVARWRAEHEGIATLTVRFTPSGEGWRVDAGMDLPVRVQLPGPFRAIAAAFAGVLLLAVVAWSRRPPKPKQPETSREGDAPVRVSKRAKAPRIVELLVRDRRRRSPIALAKVRVHRATGADVVLLSDGTTNEHGHLRLVLASPVRDGDQLLIEHPRFAPLAVDLPKAAELEVALTRRRDALLDALLAWARTRFSLRVAGPPTPAQVEEAARVLPEPVREPAHTWIGAVERAAFADSPPDEREQRRIERLENHARAADSPVVVHKV